MRRSLSFPFYLRAKEKAPNLKEQTKKKASSLRFFLSRLKEKESSMQSFLFRFPSSILLRFSPNWNLVVSVFSGFDLGICCCWFLDLILFFCSAFGKGYDRRWWWWDEIGILDFFSLFILICFRDWGKAETMIPPSFLSDSTTTREEQSNGERCLANLFLNVYDLTSVNKYLYWFGLGIYHSGIEGMWF